MHIMQSMSWNEKTKQTEIDIEFSLPNNIRQTDLFVSTIID